MLRFCEEALEQFVCTALAYHANELCDRLRACMADFTEVLESGEVYTIEELTFILHDNISSIEGIEKEIDNYKTLCNHHTSIICIYPTERITEIYALLEDFNRLKATVFAPTK